MQYKTMLSIVVILSAFTGCSTHPVDPGITMKAPAYIEQLPPKEEEGNISPNAGSLFGQGKNPLFSDQKAMNPNDIVTVVISEVTNQSSSGAKSISEDNSDSLGAGVMTANSGGVMGTVAKNINKIGNIGFQAGSSNTYTGTGSNTRNESFSTTISARIIKILNNGNYFIEGSRELLINGEKQIIQISGTIRPYDIDQTNTINSIYIADAKILYKTEGEIDRATTKPWGSKFVESLWPF